MMKQIEEIRLKFKKVFREFDFIDDMIYKTEGIIFKNHIHSKQDLLESRHFGKINAITEKIGDDMQNWNNNGKLASEEKKFYYQKREEVDDILHELNKKIENREPTWWESVKGSFESFKTLIMENLPIIAEMIPYVGKYVKYLPNSFKEAGNKLLALVR